MILKRLSALFAVILVYSFPLQAQERWQWPEHPLNIKVLPSTISASELRSAMQEFRDALGVRCNYCHVGEEGKPFSEWDFASDDNPNKERAREMILMIYDIDEHLAKIQPSGDQRVYVSCYTCHRGRPRPMNLGEEIGEVYRKEGLEPAVMHLSKLKEEYYGRGVFDFENDQVLSAFGTALLDSSKNEEALRIFKLNLEKFPESSLAWSDLSAVYIQMGDSSEAIKSLEKALELNPRNRQAQRMLEELKK